MCDVETIAYSAEAIALMLVAELEGSQVSVPWLPSHFLTTPQ